jgi:hypothetical protein
MTRPLFSDTSPPPVGGPSFLAQDFAVKNLTLEAATAPLTNVALDGGAVNAITADIRDLFVDGDFVAGQAIRFAYPGAANAPGGVTIELTPVDAAGTATAAPITKDLLTADGSALVEDQLTAGLMVQAVYHAGAFQITSSIFGTNEASRFHWQYVESAVWSKPLGLNPDTLVTVLARAAGGGGNLSRGGGGGGAAVRWMTLSEIAATENVVIGAPGVGVSSNGLAGVGGNTSFGSHLTAFGGGPAGVSGSARPGLGGGLYAPGAVSSADLTLQSEVDAIGQLQGGNGGQNIGGRSVWGGGGGILGSFGPSLGLSLYSGDGGGPDESGGLPSGGGGSRADGGRGQLDIWI